MDTVPKAKVVFCNCPKHSDHAKIWYYDPLTNFLRCVTIFSFGNFKRKPNLMTF